MQNICVNIPIEHIHTHERIAYSEAVNLPDPLAATVLVCEHLAMTCDTAVDAGGLVMLVWTCDELAMLVWNVRMDETTLLGFH